MRRFRITATTESATALVAEGVVFGDGSCAVRTLDVPAVTVYASLDLVEWAHTSHGRATLRMLDPED